MRKEKIVFIIGIITIIISSIISVYAASYLYNSNEVSYNNTSSGITSDNVQGAIDELYTEATNYAQIREMIYPVGSIYISVEDDTVAKVEARFGGTWESFGAGRTLVGVNTSETEFNTVEKTGGEKTHKLTIAEMPSHDHELGTYLIGTTPSAGTTKRYAVSGGSGTVNQWFSGTSSKTGSDGAHNNLQPYITVYMYKRTA